MGTPGTLILCFQQQSQTHVSFRCFGNCFSDLETLGCPKLGSDVGGGHREHRNSRNRDHLCYVAVGESLHGFGGYSLGDQLRCQDTFRELGSILSNAWARGTCPGSPHPCHSSLALGCTRLDAESLLQITFHSDAQCQTPAPGPACSGGRALVCT